jgi:hypothetical protein
VSFVNGGNGFASQSFSRIHFGLGAATAVDRLEIVWPSGAKQSFESLPADRIYVITEGDRIAVPEVASLAVKRK